MPRLRQGFRVPESAEAAYRVELQPAGQDSHLDVLSEGIRRVKVLENVRNKQPLSANELHV